MSRAPNFGGGRRYQHPQAWIDHVVQTDPALSNVRLSYPPRFSRRLKDYGTARRAEPGLPGYIKIGRASLVSRRDLLDTIIHEETHHRLWQRVQAGSVRAARRMANLMAEEAYVAEVAYRFLRLQDYVWSVRRK